MPFRNSTFGGQALVRDVIRSPNFVAGSDGWQLERNGNAELNDVTIRGSLDVNGNVVLDGSDLLVIEDDGGGPLMTFTEAAGTWNGLSYPAGFAYQTREDPLTDPAMQMRAALFSTFETGTTGQTGWLFDRIDTVQPSALPGRIFGDFAASNSTRPTVTVVSPSNTDGATPDTAYISFLRLEGTVNTGVGTGPFALLASGTTRVFGSNAITLEGSPIEFDSDQRIWSGTEFPFENPTIEGVAIIGDHYQANRNAGILLHLNRNTSNGEVIRFRRSDIDVGSIDVTTTNTSYGTSSDYRLKGNVADLAGCLDRILACAPRTFTWNVDGSLGEGFIAHELAAHIPAAVSGEKDAVYDGSGEDPAGTPSYQSVDLGRLTPHLVGAVQEIYARLVALETATT